MEYFKKNKRKFIIIIIVLLFFGAGMNLRIQRRFKKDLSGDEKYQIFPMEGSFRQTIEYSRYNVQFPGDHILIYPFYKMFGRNKWGLAIPHIAITILGFYLLYILCLKYFKTILAYIVTFSLFTFNYNLIYHAFEIRPYGVLVTLAIAVFIVIQYIFENDNPPLLKKILISAFIFITILFHVYGSYILFFSYIFHLLSSRNSKTIGAMLLKHLKYYSPAVIFALPIWYWFVFSDNNAAPGFVSIGDTFEFIHKGLISILKGVFGNLTGARRFYILLPGIIINFFIPHKERFKQMMFFIILIIIPIGLLLLICTHFQYWFIQRLFIWAIPLFAFFLGWCWDSIFVYLVDRFRQYKGKLSQA